MTDLETYRYWATTTHAIEDRWLRGEITGEESDRLVRNMEERLGVDRWSAERWGQAYLAWRAESGA